MNARIWGIIGGVALVLALLSPLVLGSGQKVGRLFEAAEALYERSDYEGAIVKYKAALTESKKFGAKTERINKDFTTLVNLRIARCYYELTEKTQDVKHYQSALRHIEEVAPDAQVAKHQEELTYLWAECLYKIGDFDQAKFKFLLLIEKFPKSRWVEKALYATGDINTKQENYDAALNAFKKLVDKFPHSELKIEAERHIVEIEDSDNGDTSPDPPEPNREREVKVMYDDASNSQRQGRVHEAYQRYTDLITQYPDSKYVTDAHVGRAEIHLEAKDYANARANYEEAMRNTNDQERTIELYEAYHRTYLVPEYADRQRQHNPNDKLFVKARLLREEKRWLEAAKIYEQLANSNLSAEDTIYALYWTGYCYHKAALQNPTLTDVALLRKSIDAFKELITDHGNSLDGIKTYYRLALTYTDWAKVSGDQSKWQLVIDTVKKANIKYTNNDDTAVKGWLSRMQELKDDALAKLPPPPNHLKEEAEHAIKTAETAIERAKQKNNEPHLIHQANEHLKHAKQHRHRREYKDALIKATEANEIMKKASIPLQKKDYADQGRIHLRQGELEVATKKVKQALNLDPNYPPAHKLLLEIKESYYGRGWTFFDEGHYSRSIVEFRNAINIDSNFKEAHCHLGVIYIEQQKYNKAIKALKNAINIDVEFKEAYFNLALAHLKLGEFEYARNAATAVLEIDPNYEPARMLIEFIAD